MGGFPKKGGGLRQFSNLRGGLARKRWGGVFEGGGGGGGGVGGGVDTDTNYACTLSNHCHLL